MFDRNPLTHHHLPAQSQSSAMAALGAIVSKLAKFANVDFTVSTTSAGVVGTADSNPHSILQIAAPSNQRVRLRSFEIGFRGTTVTGSPLILRILRQSTAGTGGTSVTPTNTNSIAETIQTTALRGAFSAEPTAGAVIWNCTCHPQLSSGKALTFSQEWICPGGGRLGLDVTDPSSTGFTANATFYCEE